MERERGRERTRRRVGGGAGKAGSGAVSLSRTLSLWWNCVSPNAQADALIDALAAKRVRCDPSRLGTGLWRAAYVRGTTPRWKWLAAVAPNNDNRAGQARVGARLGVLCGKERGHQRAGLLCTRLFLLLRTRVFLCVCGLRLCESVCGGVRAAEDASLSSTGSASNVLTNVRCLPELF
eukprot:6179093-Pleurochrysis_carterae.AAC.3